MLFVGVLECLSLPCFLFGRRKILRLTSVYILFVVVMKCLSLLRFLLVRRKILRLYWADAIIISCKTQ